MIDSHCHIGIGKEWASSDIEALLARASAAGVEKILTVACCYDDVDSLARMLKHKNVYGAFGIHPENAAVYDAARVGAVFKTLPDLKAFGEIGLDYFYAPEQRELQIKVFENQIEQAHKLQLPIIIHTRDAEEDTMSVLKSATAAGFLKNKGVLHCFTGSRKLADFALDLGFYISASGIITFKNALPLREIFERLPLESLLIETDSPYLAPVPYRGKQNESAFLPATAQQLAVLRGLSLQEIDVLTTQNFNRLFLNGESEK